MPRPRSWTDDELVAALPHCSTMAELHRRLGLRPGKYPAMIRHLERLGLDYRHLMVTIDGKEQLRRARGVTDPEFAAVVAGAKTVSDVVRALGGRPNGGMHRWASARIRTLGLDCSHFDRFANLRSSAAARRHAAPGLRSTLVRGSKLGSSVVRRRLLAGGLKEARCEGCGLDEWRGRSRCSSTTSTATTRTTAWRTFVSCAGTATPRPRPGAPGIVG